MNNHDFTTEINNQIKRCQDLLINKGKEYAENKKDDMNLYVDETGPICDYDFDRLNHFKVAANLMETTQEAALMGMLSKHIASISKMCMSKKPHDLSEWDEKITDSINYLLILAAMVRENEKNK